MCQSSVPNGIMMPIGDPDPIRTFSLDPETESQKIEFKINVNGLITRNNPNEQVCKKSLFNRQSRPVDLQICSRKPAASCTFELYKPRIVRANFKTIEVDRF